ncbi:AraC family transcriptional regulator [Streptomyces sp. NBC_00988]|uniref:AraC family transcriptional regulator n=1 Tax=Streptomyces sp. NBC_00988 TaxID=2903704 RepID=UPI00386FDE78|nr:AraC family transcriptional regulator [Streptomyces sp. NBC_00988]
MQVYVRAAGLRGLPELVADLGGDTPGLMERFGVRAADVESDDALLPAATAARLLQGAAKALGCPDFGLRLAARQDLSILGPLAIAIENSPTVGAALDCASRFLFVHSAGAHVSQQSDPERFAGTSVVVYRPSRPGEPQPAQAVDAGLGLVHRILLASLGDYGLRSVYLPHPPLASVATYTDFFGADVHFDKQDALLRVPTRLFETAVSSRANSELREIVVDYLAGHFTDPERTVSASVRAALVRGLGTAPSRIESVARWLQLHPRTLQRRLAEEGTTFNDVLDDVRSQTALRLLTQTDLPLSQIASMIDLSEQSGLTRASRRWFGKPPSQVRHEARRLRRTVVGG